MAIKIELTELQPPLLEFGSPGDFTDPRDGLRQAGPFDLRFGAARSEKILVGLVGPREMVDRTASWLERCKGTLEADSSRTQYPAFPGFSAIFRADLITASHLTVSFEGTHSELDAALALTDTKLRFETVLDVYSAGIKRLAELEATRPNVIFCCIPDELIAKCWSIENSLTEEDRSAAKALRKRKADSQLALFEAEALEEQPEDLLRRDFRRALKARAMHSRIPVQLATNGLVLDGASGQGPATRAWNSCVGLYYKAGGIPWRLRTDGPETCFVGVSFHHLQTTKRHLVHSSIAQAFSNQGEGFALRGGSVDWSDEQGREVHLSNEQAARLAVNILEEYRDRTGGIPLRVVLHKTSMFSASESQGFRDALSSVPVVELINWMPTQFRLVRFGSYPPNRGTFCRVNDSKSYIFTTGYMPELGTYPGPHIPAPAELRSDIPQDLRPSAKDILALSRMNWNTASITGGTPVTLAFARKVGGIMSEFGQKGDEEPLTSFRYYM
jgi:hypothetical protein